jgi:hypothetical protein
MRPLINRDVPVGPWIEPALGPAGDAHELRLLACSRAYECAADMADLADHGACCVVLEVLDDEVALRTALELRGAPARRVLSGDDAASRLRDHAQVEHVVLNHAECWVQVVVVRSVNAASAIGVPYDTALVYGTPVAPPAERRYLLHQLTTRPVPRPAPPGPRWSTRPDADGWFRRAWACAVLHAQRRDAATSASATEIARRALARLVMLSVALTAWHLHARAAAPYFLVACDAPDFAALHAALYLDVSDLADRVNTRVFTCAADADAADVRPVPRGVRDVAEVWPLTLRVGGRDFAIWVPHCAADMFGGDGTPPQPTPTWYTRHLWMDRRALARLAAAKL